MVVTCGNLIRGAALHIVPNDGLIARCNTKTSGQLTNIYHLNLHTNIPVGISNYY